VHFRPPSIDHGIVSFVWGVVLGGFLWLLLVGVGVSSATSLILALLTCGAVFLLVRLYGGDEPGR
jgi:FtsH-binding integral membrane protein